MAKSALNGHVNSAGPISYTVPALKYAILNLIALGNTGTASINGIVIAPSPTLGAAQKPVVLGAGDVLSASGGADFSYTGFLFDA